MRKIVIGLMLLLGGMGTALAGENDVVDEEGTCYMEVDKIPYSVGNCTIIQTTNDEGDAILSVTLDDETWKVKAVTDPKDDSKATVSFGKTNGKLKSFGLAKWDETELGTGCLVNEHVRFCGSPSTTPVNQTFMQEGKCLYEVKFKRLIDGDCVYFVFKEPQVKSATLTVDRGKILVMAVNEDGQIQYDVVAEVAYTSTEKGLGAGTLMQLRAKGDKIGGDQIDAVGADGPCWVGGVGRLCIWKVAI